MYVLLGVPSPPANLQNFPKNPRANKIAYFGPTQPISRYASSYTTTINYLCHHIMPRGVKQAKNRPGADTNASDAANNAATSGSGPGSGTAGSGTTTTTTKDTEYSLDDLLLPRSVISRIAKEALPEGTQFPRDGILALARSATVFINYLASEANMVTVNSGRKTVSAADIQQGLENAGFGMLVGPVRKELEKQESVFAKKKAQKLAAAKAKLDPSGSTAEETSTVPENKASKRQKIDAVSSSSHTVVDVDNDDDDEDDDDDNNDPKATGFESDNENEDEQQDLTEEFAGDDTEPENPLVIDVDGDEDEDERPAAWEIKNSR